jgi:CBS domain-containing protein
MLTARQLMRQPVAAIQPADSVAAAVREMQARGISSLIVLPKFAGDAFGIITKADIVGKVVAKGRDPRRVHVADAMTRPVVTVRPESSLRECAALMMRHHVRRLPVCAGDGAPLGMVSDSDVFDALLHIHTDGAASFSL